MHRSHAGMAAHPRAYRWHNLDLGLLTKKDIKLGTKWDGGTRGNWRVVVMDIKLHCVNTWKLSL